MKTYEQIQAIDSLRADLAAIPAAERTAYLEVAAGCLHTASDNLKQHATVTPAAPTPALDASAAPAAVTK